MVIVFLKSLIFERLSFRFLQQEEKSFAGKTRKIVRWFKELINLNHRTILITEFHQKRVENWATKFSYIPRTHRSSFDISPYLNALGRRRQGKMQHLSTESETIIKI